MRQTEEADAPTDSAEELDRGATVASDLEQYISRADPQYRNIINEVAEALRTGGEEAQRLAQADVIRNIPAEALVPKGGRGRDRLAGSLNLFTAILFIAPVFVTWWHLQDALLAFDQLIEAEPERGQQSFLTLWQSGFGNRSTELSTVAVHILVTLTMLAVCMVLSMLVRRPPESARRDIQRARATLLDAQVELASYALASPREFVGELKDLARRLDRVGKSADKAASATQKLLADAEDSIRLYRETVDRIDTRYGQAFSVIDSLEQSVTRLAGTTESLAAKVSGVEESLMRSANASGEAMSQLRETTDSLNTTVERQTLAATELVGAARSVADDREGYVNTAIEGHAALSESLSEIRALQTEANRHQVELQSASTRLAEHTATLAAAARQLGVREADLKRAIGSAADGEAPTRWYRFRRGG